MVVLALSPSLPLTPLPPCRELARRRTHRSSLLGGYCLIMVLAFSVSHLDSFFSAILYISPLSLRNPPALNLGKK